MREYESQDFRFVTNGHQVLFSDWRSHRLAILQSFLSHITVDFATTSTLVRISMSVCALHHTHDRSFCHNAHWQANYKRERRTCIQRSMWNGDWAQWRCSVHIIKTDCVAGCKSVLYPHTHWRIADWWETACCRLWTVCSCCLFNDAFRLCKFD